MSAAPRLHQLRFIFADAAPLLRFVPGVTMGDIARLWSEMGCATEREPVGIAVTFAEAAAPVPDHLPATNP